MQPHESKQPSRVPCRQEWPRRSRLSDDKKRSRPVRKTANQQQPRPVVYKGYYKDYYRDLVVGALNSKRVLEVPYYKYTIMFTVQGLEVEGLWKRVQASKSRPQFRAEGNCM